MTLHDVLVLVNICNGSGVYNWLERLERLSFPLSCYSPPLL